MDKKEIIRKIEESDSHTSIIIDKDGNCLKAFPECYNFETDLVEYQTVDNLHKTIPVTDVVSIFNSKDLFSMMMTNRDSELKMEEQGYVIKKILGNKESGLVIHFPYNLLIRCASLLRQAEHNFFDFCCEYGKHITETGEASMKLSFFDGIPITDDERYLLYLQVEDCTVTDFSIVSKPILNSVSKEIRE